MTVEVAELAQLYPMDQLRAGTREQLASDAADSRYERDEVVFREGDIDHVSYYLLEGEVTGTYTDGRSKAITAGSLQARYSLGDAQPRRFTAIVTSAEARLARLDRRYTEKVVAWDQLTQSSTLGAGAGEGTGSDRWVFRLLASRAFHKLPTGNIERMFSKFEEVDVAAGEEVVREGDAADYFYVIKDGTASVAKMLDGAESIVAYLVRGDCFGEDALLANTTRNATVRMMQNGSLMRLSLRDFEDVLKPPVVEWLSAGQASIMTRNGAQVVDVRLPVEFEQRAIKGALNVPLAMLREEASESFDKQTKYIIYCNTGERSAAAAFIMTRLGFEVYALRGGLAAMLRQVQSQTET